jgi:hypothetical protein
MNKYLQDIVVKSNNIATHIEFKQESLKVEEFMELFKHDYIKDILIKWFLKEYPCYKREDIKDIYIESTNDSTFTVKVEIIPTLEYVDIDFIIGGN